MSREPVAAVGLAVGIAALYISPQHVASALSLYQPGVEYVAGGIERCALWLFAAWVAYECGLSVIARVLLWPAYEGGMMAASRLALPMDRMVKLPPGQTVGEAAFGPWATWASIAIAFWGAAYVAQGLRDGRRADRR